MDIISLSLSPSVIHTSQKAPSVDKTCAYLTPNILESLYIVGLCEEGEGTHRTFAPTEQDYVCFILS